MNRDKQKGTPIRNGLVALGVALCTITSAVAQVSVSVNVPGVSIGINQPAYPELVVVPEYPVYYAPQVNANYFFYDGMFWVYDQDNWYASAWYNGPWQLVDPDTVPLFILRIPVRYYRQPPSYFQGWSPDAPPRWGDHWGQAWQQRRSGWDTWNHSSVPAPAPLPAYQRQYSGNRYPPAAQQQVLLSQNYHYKPQDTVAQRYYQTHGAQSAPASPRGPLPASQGATRRNADSRRRRKTKKLGRPSPRRPRRRRRTFRGPRSSMGPQGKRRPTLRKPPRPRSPRRKQKPRLNGSLRTRRLHRKPKRRLRSPRHPSRPCTNKKPSRRGRRLPSRPCTNKKPSLRSRRPPSLRRNPRKARRKAASNAGTKAANAAIG